MSAVIKKFESIGQARKLLEEWKIRLGLHDWTIKVNLSEPHEFKLQDCDGECEYTMVIKSARIQILKPEYYGDRILKYCAERILVHELLHCKFAHLDTDNEGYNREIHIAIEDIARALVCAKYDIPLDWFNNISYEEEGDNDAESKAEVAG